METRVENVCKICGKHFFAPRKMKICSEACKREDHRQRARIWAQEHGRANIMRDLTSDVPKSIDAKAAAKAAGLTYGQYMAAKRYGAVFPGVM